MTGSVALVTGATKGIGRAISLALADDGWRVGVCARTAADVDDFVQVLESRGNGAAGCPADVGDPDDVRALVERVESRLGPVDLLVNNAGVAIIKPFSELDLDEWDRTMSTNLRSMFLVTGAVLPGMRRRGSGTIINIASLAGRNGIVGGTAYTASKHAVLGFSRSLMLEVRKDGVRVIAICPGSVDTPLIHNSFGGKDPDRILKPEDVAATVLNVMHLPPRAMVSELDIRPTNP
ncbi:MAG: SDR family oxidoreductase [Gemmatimonadales bacterium]